jgi:predicted O-linked N-acetylglucosamine transferase (SPINDLY family)
VATVQEAFKLALQHHQAGRLAEAEVLYRQILAVEPRHFDAQHLLGVIAHQTGHYEVAVQLIGQALLLNPNDAAAHSNLGEAQRLLGRFDDATVSFRRALALNPNSYGAHNNLGVVLQARHHLEESAAEYERALELRPDFAEALANLATVRHEQRRLDEAIEGFRQALVLKPGSAEFHNNLAVTLQEQARFEESAAACRRALEIQPNLAPAYNNLAISLHRLDRNEEAIVACQRALELQPNVAEAHLNLANSLRQLGRLDEAVEANRRALELRPGYAEAQNNLANALKDRGEMPAAIDVFRQTIEWMPDRVEAHDNLIYALHFLAGASPSQITEEQRRWNARFADPIRQLIQPQTNDRDPDRRLRVGYVSPDFWDHVVGRNILPLFREHDRGRVEIFCYSALDKDDAIGRSFRRLADGWRSSAGMSDEAMAELIRRDQIDILVDLTQHMAKSRLPVFARQPAPVQLSFAGYPATTGLPAIPYRISDKWLEGDFRLPIFDCRLGEASMRTGTSETAAALPYLKKGHESVYLLDSFWCYDPCGTALGVNDLPAQTNGFVTFGCLNNFCKVNDLVLNLWARVLQAVPESRLILLAGSGSHRQRTCNYLDRQGINTSRVQFADPRPREKYLRLYHELDIALDTFPYNGHTTSLDAFWMGVPVVSVAGETPVSRAGWSQLSNLGLPELAAQSEDAFVDIAIVLARDIPRLADLRRTLRSRMEASVLMDAPRFARQIETAYRAVWREWCASGRGGAEPT